MPDELTELLDIAISKEIESRAFYVAGQKTALNPGAEALMKELAAEESKHAQLLKELKEKGLNQRGRRRNEVPNLRISEYLIGGETLKGAGLQDTVIFAIKREQQSVEFYSKLMSLMRDESAKRMCERLVHEELTHKLRLEIFYDDSFFQED